jgi:UDP-galactose transporter B1
MMTESTTHYRSPHPTDDDDKVQLLPLIDPSTVIPPLGVDQDHHDAAAAAKASRTEVLKFIFGAGGIWSAYLYYGSLQEDVFRYRGASHDGQEEAFTQAWFLQFVEALANVIVGYIGRVITVGVPNLPLHPFFLSGATQVSSKALTSLALANGLSFPVATLAKSGKMAPVMAGQLLLGGAHYALRDYLQVAAIILGTATLSLGKKVKRQNASASELVCW